MGLLEATRIPAEFADNTIQFEVSCGEHGYRDSIFTEPINRYIISREIL